MKVLARSFSLIVVLSMMAYTIEAGNSKNRSSSREKSLKRRRKQAHLVRSNNMKTENSAANNLPGGDTAPGGPQDGNLVPLADPEKRIPTAFSDAGVFGYEKVCDYTTPEGPRKGTKSEIYGLFITLKDKEKRHELPSVGCIPKKLKDRLATPEAEMEEIKKMPEAERKERIKAEYAKIYERLKDPQFANELSEFSEFSPELTDRFARLWNPETSPDAGETDFLTAYYIPGSDKDKDPIVMVHGGPGGSANQMLDTAADLSQETGRSVLIYTQRGCRGSGASFDSDRDAFRQSVEDLDKVIDAARELTKRDKVGLFGHSFGPLIVNQYTARYPEGKKVAAAVAVSPIPVDKQGLMQMLIKRNEEKWEHGKRLKQEKNPYLKNFLHEIIGMTQFYNLDKAVDIFNKDPKSDHGKYAELFDRLKIHEPSNSNSYLLRSDYFARIGEILQEELKKIRTPTLVMHGEGDSIPIFSSELMAKLISNAEFQLILKTAHAPFVEKPEDFYPRVRKFLDKHLDKDNASAALRG